MSDFQSTYFKQFGEISGRQFDFVVVGGGAYGAAFAHRMLALDAKARVLLLEKGGYLLPDHIQNLPPAYIDLNGVGAQPWTNTGDRAFMPQIPFLGGRALLWNAWIPRPERSEMPGWPDAVIDELTPEWDPAAAWLGRRANLAAPGNDNAQLNRIVLQDLSTRLDEIRTARRPDREEMFFSSMAAGADPDSFRKFAPVSKMIGDLVKYLERFAVVPQCLVTRLVPSGEGSVEALETSLGSLPLRGARVILANSTLEATALVLNSYPRHPLAGRNLSGHIRSWAAFRVHRREYADLADWFQSSAFYISGYDAGLDRWMHTHLSVVFNPHPRTDASAELLYRLLPDASSREAIEAYQDPDYVVYMLHVMGEFLGTTGADSPNYIKTNAGQTIVNVKLTPRDWDFWKVMDDTAWETIRVLAGERPLQYQQEDGTWDEQRPANIRNKGLVHESGTLWMGEYPASSVSALDGSLHAAPGVFTTGGMRFPRPGSWNPTYTGVAMSFAMARRFAGGTAHAP